MDSTDTGSNGDGTEQQQAGGDREDGDGGDTSLTQRLVTAVSVALAVVLFSFLGWQAVTVPSGGPPQVSVENTAAVGSDVRVTVAVSNPTAAGFERVTVQVSCTDPPKEVVVEHVPAGDRRRAHVLCPAWNRSSGASLSSWSQL